MDSELVKLNQALRAPGMRDAALRSVSIPAANLAVWLWAVLRYGLAQRRGLPTGLLLRQIDATLAREQARLGQFQFQAHDLLEQTLSLAKRLEDAQVSHNNVVETLNQAQCGHFHKWPMKSALLTPMHMWTTQLQVTSPYVPYVSLPVHFIPLLSKLHLCPSTCPHASPLLMLWSLVHTRSCRSKPRLCLEMPSCAQRPSSIWVPSHHSGAKNC